MDQNVKAMIYHIGGRFWDYAFNRISTGHGNPVERRIDQINKVIDSLPAKTEELTENATTAPETPKEATPPVAETSPTPYSGTSQLTAHGAACVPCGSSHFQTVAGGLSEAMRFARSDGVSHPEVIDRINTSETELNTFERWDGSPEKVAKLQGEEKKLMDDMLNASRELRHRLSDLKSVDELEQTAARAQNLAVEFRSRLFTLQIGTMTPEMKDEINRRAEAVRAKLGVEEQREMTLDEAKQLAAEQAQKEVEARWKSQEKT